MILTVVETTHVVSMYCIIIISSSITNNSTYYNNDLDSRRDHPRCLQYMYCIIIIIIVIIIITLLTITMILTVVETTHGGLFAVTVRVKLFTHRHTDTKCY